MSQTSSVPVGTHIISFNGWRDFETTAFVDKFRTLSYEEAQGLVPGDAIYVEAAEYPHGKVYGRIKVLVLRIEPLSTTHIRVRYNGCSQAGSIIVDKNKNSPIEVAKDENELAQLVKSLPESSIWGLHE